MPFLLHPNLKADMWAKHKSFLTGSTGVGDKLKTLEKFAKCKEDDATGLHNLLGAIAALMQVAVTAHQKAKSSKIIPSSTTKYLKDMIDKATELRSLVATKLEELESPKANNPKAPSDEWFTKSIEKIKINRNSMQLLNQEIINEHLSGKEVEEFKNWAKTSQANLKKINDDLISKNVDLSESQKIDAAINQFFNDLKGHQNEINEVITETEKEKALNESWSTKSIERIKSYRNSIQSLNQEIISKHIEGDEINAFKTWATTSQANLNKISNDLASGKIDTTQSQKIDSALNSYLKDLTKYEKDIKEKIIEDAQEKVIEQQWTKSSLEKIKTYRNSLQVINQEIISNKIDGKEIEEFKTWANTSQANLNKISTDLTGGNIDTTQFQEIDTTISNYMKDLTAYEKEINQKINDNNKEKVIEQQWTKQSLEKIKNYRNSIMVLNQEVTANKLSGKEVDAFKNWVKANQSKLVKINSTLSTGEKIGSQRTVMEQTINNYEKELKNFQNDITEQINTKSKP